MTPSSKCTRGARTAARAPSPRSTTATIVCRIAERMRLEPALPSTSSTSPSRSTTDGDIMLGMRLPAGWRWKPSGLRSSSPITLLMCIPVPGTTTPEPSPLVHVTLQARPSESSTEMCVVEPSFGGEEPLEEALLREPLHELRCALALSRAHRSDDGPQRRGRGVAIEQRQRVGEQRAARRRRRVGEHHAVAVGDAQRLRARSRGRRRARVALSEPPRSRSQRDTACATSPR